MSPFFLEKDEEKAGAGRWFLFLSAFALCEWMDWSLWRRPSPRRLQTAAEQVKVKCRTDGTQKKDSCSTTVAGSVILVPTPRLQQRLTCLFHLDFFFKLIFPRKNVGEKTFSFFAGTTFQLLSRITSAHFGCLEQVFVQPRKFWNVWCLDRLHFLQFSDDVSSSTK